VRSPVEDRGHSVRSSAERPEPEEEPAAYPEEDELDEGDLLPEEGEEFPPADVDPDEEPLTVP
jgi:hypothetical protein